MGRLDRNDARAETPPALEPAQSRDAPSERDREPAVRQLSDQIPRRPLDRDHDQREHHLTLPTGATREFVRDGADTYDLRGSEVYLLERAARFRSVFTEHLQQNVGTTTNSA